MKRLLLALLFLLSLAGMTHAQSTVVSGSVTDTSSQTWNSGTINFQFVPNPQYPSGPYTWTGGTLPTNVSGVLNTSGSFSVSVPSNTAISPIGTSWAVQVCPQASWPCFTLASVTIAGGTQTLNITPPAIAISLTNPPSSPVLAYADSEISSALIGSYYYNLPMQNYRFCQAVTVQVCTLWNSFGAGPPPTGFPRLDQVLNQNVSKTFNQGGASLSFVNGPGLDLSGETSPFAVPAFPNCSTNANAQICFDSVGLNYHAFINGADAIIGTLVSFTGNNGDVAGFAVNAGNVSITDLGPVNTTNGDSFLKVTMSSPLAGDIPCADLTTNEPLWPNCTPGAADTSINGSANSYTISFADQLTTIDHDTAGSASVTVTLPTADTLGLNPGFVFIYSNHSTHSDSIAPTTWTINGSATQTVTPNNACHVRVDPFSATNWIADCFPTNPLSATGPIVLTSGVISCPTCGTGSGNLSGTLTSGKVPVASGANTLIDGSILDDNSHAARDNNGFDVNSLGAYLYWIANNTGTGTTVNKMVCDDGTGKGIICSHTTSTTNDPLGVAVAANGATPGTSGSTGICNIGFCTVVMDNSATANHYAQQSTTVDGDLSDVGATVPTNGQPYWHIVVGNAGVGTTAVFRNMDSSELNASSGGNGKSTTVQIDTTSTKNIANFSDSSQCSNWTTSGSGNTTTVVYHPCHGLSFTLGDSQNSSALTTSFVAYMSDVPFACTIKSYALSIDAGTITVKFWKVAGGTAIPTSGNSINTSGVGISSGTRIKSTTLTDFTTTSVASGDQIAMAVTAVATAKTVNGVLSCQE